MKNIFKIFLLLPLAILSSGCIATALATERETVVNWKERCADRCASKHYHVTMYHQDGHVEEATVAIYDFSNNIGCFCPLDQPDKK